MSDGTASTSRTYQVADSIESAIGRLREALGSDVIVREEEDGVGRFAGERPIMLVGRGGKTVKLLRGSWSEIKPRSEEAMVEIRVGGNDGSLEIEVERVEKAEHEPSLVSQLVGEFISTVILLAAAIYGVNRFRGLEVDYAKMGMIAAGGSLLYVVAKHFFGDEEEKLGNADWLMARAGEAFTDDTDDDEADEG